MARPDPKPSFGFIVCSDNAQLRARMRKQIAELGPIVETQSWSDCQNQLNLEIDNPHILILDADPWDTANDWLTRVAALQSIEHRLITIMLSPNRDAENAIAAIGHGCFEYLIKPFNNQHLRTVIHDAIRIIQQSPIIPQADSKSSTPSRASTPEEDHAKSLASKQRLIGHSPPMLRVYKQIGQAAASNVEVLITGESGTGKELVARALHDNSPRRDNPFVAINCAAIPDTLLESELFGHERGAFTGADRNRIGKFEQALGGTVLLDEIGDMSPILQAKILRLVQDQSFYRVGGNELLHADVRLLAATHQPLEERIAEGQFRADLFYRLRVVHIHLTPLRQRDEDIILLAHHFAALFSRDLNRNITAFHPETNKRLLQHQWPGNVRELQNVIKQAIVVSHGTVLRPEFLPELIALPHTPNHQIPTTPTTHHSVQEINPEIPEANHLANQTLEDLTTTILAQNPTDAYETARALLDQAIIKEALELHQGNISAAARHLGITRITLRRKLASTPVQMSPQQPDQS